MKGESILPFVDPSIRVKQEQLLIVPGYVVTFAIQRLPDMSTVEFEVLFEAQ
jgi:hypothetical protein